jgi:hypothetical protein
MSLDDLEREILKVTKQGGTARVCESTLLEAFEEQGEGREEMDAWQAEFCREHFLVPDQDKDMFGDIERLYHHT